MKRTLQITALLAFCLGSYAQTNEYMVLELANGSTQKLDIKDVVRVTFETEPDTEYAIDANYIPSLSEILGTWSGEYEGWDKNQKTTTKIKRELNLYSNGTYHNYLQGTIGSRTEYVDFERETGTFNYDKQSQLITYTVQTDSLLDFRTHEMMGFTKKGGYGYDVSSYTEKVQFSYPINNLRRWIMQDDNIVIETDKTKPVVYAAEKIKAATIKGTLESPFTASEALDFASSLEADKPTKDYFYIKGFITEIKEVSTQYGNATYYIANNKTDNNTFYIYRGHYLNNDLFTSENQIKVGDEVMLYARLVNYRGSVPETSQGECFIYSLERNTYFEIPYTNWSATSTDVKKEMDARNFTLLEEGTNASGWIYLAYTGKYKEATTMYRFNATGILAEIDIAFFNMTIDNLRDYVTSELGYTFITKTDDGDYVYNVPDNSSYAIIWSSLLSDGSEEVSYVTYIEKKATARTKSSKLQQTTEPITPAIITSKR